LAAETVHTVMAAPAPETVARALGGPITRADLPVLGERVGALLDESDADVILCDVAGVRPDAVTLDALARVHLAARRHGCNTRVRGASSELLALLDFCGLRDLAPV
jgi:ABC-type transporter Mla MlaB component